MDILASSLEQLVVITGPEAVGYLVAEMKKESESESLLLVSLATACLQTDAQEESEDVIEQGGDYFINLLKKRSPALLRQLCHFFERAF